MGATMRYHLSRYNSLAGVQQNSQSRWTGVMLISFVQFHLYILILILIRSREMYGARYHRSTKQHHNKSDFTHT